MLTTGVNFINILCARFLYKSALRSFSLVTFWLWQNDFDEKSTFVQKSAHKMLMKLTIDLYFYTWNYYSSSGYWGSNIRPKSSVEIILDFGLIFLLAITFLVSILFPKLTMDPKEKFIRLFRLVEPWRRQSGKLDYDFWLFETGTQCYKINFVFKKVLISLKYSLISIEVVYLGNLKLIYI